MNLLLYILAANADNEKTNIVNISKVVKEEDKRDSNPSYFFL